MVKKKGILKRKNIITFGLIGFILISIVIGRVLVQDVYNNQSAYKEKLIRFHVIANSDSPQDQALKLKVRDHILETMTEKFEVSSSIAESRNIIKDNLGTIKDLAQTELTDQESNYDVNVYFGDYDFPTKSYGNFTLPAGNYEAVKVVIGEGQGQNWWCVMFPPLCFIDITNGLTNNETQSEFKNVLSEDEYNMIVSAKSDDEIPIKLKFKVVELFEKNKMRFAKVFVGEK